MSQDTKLKTSSLSLNKLYKNEIGISNAAKAAEIKLNLVTKERNELLQLVSQLKNRISVLDNKICNYDAMISVLEKEIEEVVMKTEEMAVATELIKWKQSKVKMVNDLEKERTIAQYEKIEQYKQRYEARVKVNSPNLQQVCDKTIAEENCKKEKLQIKINNLLIEIENKKKKLFGIDKNKLHQDIQILQNRNIALNVRMERQIQETEARLRQKMSEFNYLQKVLEEKNDVLSRLYVE